MNRKEFQRAPGLLREKDAIGLGYARCTLMKYVDCHVLRRIKPPGCGQAHYQKRQLAQLLDWPEVVAADEEQFSREPQFMRRKAVRRWTGLDRETLAKLVDHSVLKPVQPPGTGEAKYLKSQIAALIGMEHCV